MISLFSKPFIQHLPTLSTNGAMVDVLRLDVLHTVVSGNKWYKLQLYLQDAIDKKCNKIITFGGAFSNHLVATAFACKQLNLQCVAIIRGEMPPKLSHTLLQCKQYGMELQFVTREMYKNKELIAAEYCTSNSYVINEGGYGTLGATGAASILKTVDTSLYTHIISACGTGTMLAGIAQSAMQNQIVIGINVLKGYDNLEFDIRKILPENNSQIPFSINNEYHFGGYAKHPKELINWMNDLWLREKLPTDIVYTSKLLFATKDLVSKKYFDTGAKILVIHSGGLQGNLSLLPNTLLF